MKETYVEKTFRAKSLELLATANDIIEEYFEMGYDLTLRQLYYQFVARDIVPNSQRSYQNLGNLINDGRLAGEIDWARIKDRTRHSRSNTHWSSPAQIIRSAASQYAIDKWEDQENHVEVWVEKDALIDVVQKACRQLDVTCFSCRGYVSQTAMYEAAQRLMTEEHQCEKQSHIFHLGDHDPSGIDMTRDIQERLSMFGSNCEIHRIALTMTQIDDQNPPPNPAKLTDARAKRYIAEHGYQSWELDALDPRFITSLIETNVTKLRDQDVWDEAVAKEKDQRDRLMKAADKLDV